MKFLPDFSDRKLLPFKNPIRSKNQKEDKQTERDRILPFAGNLPDAEIFDKAEQESAKHSTRNAPHPANDRCDDTFQKQVQAHNWLEACVETDRDAGNTGNCRTNEKDPADNFIRIDADDFCHLEIVTNRLDCLAEFSFLDDKCEHHHNRNRGTQNNHLDLRDNAASNFVDFCGANVA